MTKTKTSRIVAVILAICVCVSMMAVAMLNTSKAAEASGPVNYQIHDEYDTSRIYCTVNINRPLGNKSNTKDFWFVADSSKYDRIPDLDVQVNFAYGDGNMTSKYDVLNNINVYSDPNLTNRVSINNKEGLFNIYSASGYARDFYIGLNGSATVATDSTYYFVFEPHMTSASRNSRGQRIVIEFKVPGTKTTTTQTTTASDNKVVVKTVDNKQIAVRGTNSTAKASDYTGIAPEANNDAHWWRVVNGDVVEDATGVYKNEYGWWRVENGKVNFSANGIYKNEHGWWKTTNGKVTFNETGVFKNEFGWWRVENSKVNFKANSIYKNDYGWWKTTNGKVTFKETGIFSNEYGTWYVKDSKVDFNKNGKVTYNGKTYTVVNGKVK